MRGLYIIFWPEIQRDAFFPIFKFPIKLADCIEQLTVRLARSLGGIELLIYLALDDRKRAHQSEQVHLALSVSQWHVPNVIVGVFAGQFDVHIVIVLDRRPSRAEAETSEDQRAHLSPRYQ